MGPADAVCRTCGAELRRGARFCHGCGAPAPDPEEQAEFKQVTVLIADVVGSMAIASTVGAERLRKMMADVFDAAAAATRRYGGTVDRFTGDGIVALFGAPVALEDHAFRACLAALDIQEQIAQLADEVQRRDGVAASAADRVELGPGDCRGNRLWTNGLHRGRRARRHGTTDGVGRPAWRGDARRIHRAAGRTSHRAGAN